MSSVNAVNDLVCRSAISPVLSRSYKSQIIYTQINHCAQTTVCFKDYRYKYTAAVNLIKGACSEVISSLITLVILS